jgi:hypothetical protein
VVLSLTKWISCAPSFFIILAVQLSYAATSGSCIASNVASVTAKINPAMLRSLNSDGVDNIELSFRNEDKINGSSDSTIKLKDFHYCLTASPHFIYSCKITV